MAVNPDYLNYILEQLSFLNDLEHKKMFGGVGFFREGIMFAMIAHDIFRLRADDGNREDYEEKGMKNFNPYNKGKGLPYFEVPVEVLEDMELLEEWTQKAYDASLRNRK